MLTVALFFGFVGRKQVQVLTIISLPADLLMTDKVGPITIETGHMYILDEPGQSSGAVCHSLVWPLNSLLVSHFNQSEVGPLG